MIMILCGPYGVCEGDVISPMAGLIVLFASGYPGRRLAALGRVGSALGYILSALQACSSDFGLRTFFGHWPFVIAPL